jgi:hypothetical protein
MRIVRRNWSTRVWVLLVWTAGLIAVWVVANAVLDPGVTDEDVQECLREGFIPPEECEETLEALEDEEEPVLGIGASFLVWLVGCFLLWLVTRPPQVDDSP